MFQLKGSDVEQGAPLSEGRVFMSRVNSQKFRRDNSEL